MRASAVRIRDAPNRSTSPSRAALGTWLGTSGLPTKLRGSSWVGVRGRWFVFSLSGIYFRTASGGERSTAGKQLGEQDSRVSWEVKRNKVGPAVNSALFIRGA